MVQLKRFSCLMNKKQFNIARLSFGIIGLAFTSACTGSLLIEEAREAEDEGRIIDNEMMVAMYPSSYRPGKPPYLERDFEAGAEFICDEIKLKYDRDICSEAKINWREDID